MAAASVCASIAAAGRTCPTPAQNKETRDDDENKVAVIYGAGGAVGSAVTRAFRPRGESFSHRTHLAPVKAVAKDIVSAGGPAETAEVDALDEQAVDRHLQSVIDKAGRVDISFNAVGIPNTKIQGAPDRAGCRAVLPADRDVHQVVLSDRRLAARRMVENRSGVIMTVTSIPSRTGIPLVGGVGPAMAAVEALTRDLSAELAPQGIRVVGLRPQGMPETRRIKEVFGLHAKASGVSWEQFHELLASRTHARRLFDARGDG